MRSSLFRTLGIGVLVVLLVLSGITTASAEEMDVTFEGSYDTADCAFGVAVSGNYAYVADNSNGLVIVDISNPASPSLTGSYDTGNARGVVVSDKYAYVADDSAGLVIVDISNPASPSLAGSYDTGWARRVVVSGNYAYVADWNNGLVVVDISDPTNPTRAGGYDTAGNALGVAVSGNYAYVADYSGGLLIIDISDPEAPTLAYSYDTADYARDVTVSGNYAYVADNSNGLVIIDISVPTAPAPASSYDTVGAHGVAVSDNYAYVADFYNGLVIVDISEPTTPKPADNYNTAGNAYDVAVSSNYAYLADGKNGLVIFNTGAPSVSNNPPTATISSISPNPVFEGMSIEFDASGSNDPDGDALTYRWDFDNDGMWDYESPEPTATYTWDDDYTGQVTLEVSDGELTATGTTTLTVNNIAPVVDAGTDIIVDEGTIIGFSGICSDLGSLDTHTILWDFGDGSTESSTLTPSHVYADEGAYTVTLTVTDDDGGETTDTITIIVNNVAPVANAGADQTVNEGTIVSFSGSATDVGADTLTYSWNFGDGTTITGASPTHSYADNGIYIATLTVTDDDGGEATDTITVTVNNVAPTVTAIEVEDVIDENGVATFSGIISDPGILDTFEVVIDWGDGNDAETFSYSAGTTAFSETHQYLDDDPSKTPFDDCIIRVTVSDNDDIGTNTISTMTSDVDAETAVVRVQNIAPEINSLSFPLDPIAVGNAAIISSSFVDLGTLDTHKATIDWGDGTASTVNIPDGDRELTNEHTYLSAGIYTVTLKVTDDDEGFDTFTSEQYIVVYDPDGGFVTGGGWIYSPEGAYSPNDDLTGKAIFGFVSKYKKGATVPTGSTEFQFKVADLNFHSNSYEWLVITGHNAMYKGTGTINGEGNYGFMISAIDEDLTPSTDVDMFRIKIWDRDKATDNIVYDNNIGSDDGTEDDAEPATAIGGGSIKVHKAK